MQNQDLTIYNLYQYLFLFSLKQLQVLNTALKSCKNLIQH